MHPNKISRNMNGGFHVATAAVEQSATVFDTCKSTFTMVDASLLPRELLLSVLAQDHVWYYLGISFRERVSFALTAASVLARTGDLLQTLRDTHDLIVRLRRGIGRAMVLCPFTSVAAGLASRATHC